MSLLFAYGKNRFSHDVAHLMPLEGYRICHIALLHLFRVGSNTSVGKVVQKLSFLFITKFQSYNNVYIHMSNEFSHMIRVRPSLI